METLYKIVGPNGECLNGGAGDWPLPVGGKPGDWRTIDGPLEACRNGLHLATAAQLPQWLPSQTYRAAPCVVYAVETEGEIIDAGEKWVAGKVRLLPRSHPMPDFAALQAKRSRALRRAEKARAIKVPDAWHGYLRALGGASLPAGHPGKPYADAIRAADRAYEAAVTKAEGDYHAAIASGLMP